jgi:hypothetical protein
MSNCTQKCTHLGTIKGTQKPDGKQPEEQLPRLGLLGLYP